MEENNYEIGYDYTIDWKNASRADLDKMFADRFSKENRDHSTQRSEVELAMCLFAQQTTGRLTNHLTFLIGEDRTPTDQSIWNDPPP